MKNLDQARSDYEIGMKYREIAEKYGVSINTVKSWQRRHKWERGPKKGVHPKHKLGAPVGNKNAVGNSGGRGGPVGNQKALRTGEHESLYRDLLDPDEQSLYDAAQTDPLAALDQEIALMSIRQRRMLKRLKSAEDDLNNEEITELYQMRKQKQSGEYKMTKVEKTIQKGGKLDLALRIEEAMTRISGQLTKAIKERQALVVADLDLGNDDDGDDGLIDALKDAGAKAWGDDDASD